MWEYKYTYMWRWKFLPIKEWNYDEILNKVIPLKYKRSLYILQGVVMEDSNGKFKDIIIVGAGISTRLFGKSKN